MNRLHVLLVCLLVSLSASAQQLPIFTQYQSNSGILNPAAVNSDYLAFEQNISLGINYRSQWNNFVNAPTTSVLSGSWLDTRRGVFNMMAGGHIMNDQAGPTGSTGVYGRFAGIITPDPYYGGISIGMSLGGAQFRIDGDQINLRDEGDILDGQSYNQWHPDVGVGVFAWTRAGRDNLFYGGISVPQVIGLELTFKNDAGQFQTQRVQHVYASAGMMHTTYNDGVLQPSVWVKYVPNAPVNVDFNVKYITPNSFWVGLGASTSQAMHIEAGLLLGDNYSFTNNFRIGYSFDYSAK